MGEKKGLRAVTIIGAVGLGTAGLIWLATRKAGAAPPEEPEEPEPGLANVYGVVANIDTGKPVSGALVTLDSKATYSDSNGAYAFVNVEPQSYTLACQKDGYEPVSGTIEAYEGNNEINISLYPTGGGDGGGGEALFEYVSDIRVEETQEEDAGGVLWTHVYFEVDIKNVGDAPGTVHPKAHYDAAMTILGGEIEPQELAPGETGTFSGEWRYYTPFETLWFRPTFIESEAGIIFFEMGVVKEPTVEIPSQIVAGQPYWASITAYLEDKPDILYRLQVSLKPTFAWPLPSYEYPEVACRTLYGISHAEYKPPYGTSPVLAGSGYYTVEGQTWWGWKRVSATEWEEVIGGGWVISPAYAITNYRNPLPRGVYDVVAYLSYNKVASYGTGALGPGGILFNEVVGQVTVA